MNVTFTLPEGLDLVELSFTRSSKGADLWSAYMRVAGQLGTLQGRFGFATAQAAIDAAAQAAQERAKEIRPERPALAAVSLKLDFSSLKRKT